MKQQIKKIVRHFQNKKRASEIRRTSEFITHEQLVKDIKDLGIVKGDILLLHSSLKQIGYVEGGADTVVKAILDVIGKEGTLIVPSFSLKGTMYNTCIDDDFVFDIRTDIRGMGAIPSAVLKLNGVKTSLHPTHATSALGRHAEEITGTHHESPSAFGPGSPTERLLNLNGKIFGLGVSLAAITFCHMLEDNEQDNFPVPVRMKKTYMVKCIDHDGKLIKVPINPLDPRFSNIRMDRDHREDLRQYFWKDFSKNGILTIGSIGMAKSWTASSQPFYNHLKSLMNEGITVYSSSEDIEKRPI